MPKHVLENLHFAVALDKVKNIESYKNLIESYGLEFLMTPNQMEYYVKEKDLKNGLRLVRISEDLLEELKRI